MSEHRLKSWTPSYLAIVSGDKKFDVRRDDRGFQKGDTVLLEQYDQAKLRYVLWTGSRRDSTKKKIKYILTGGQFGIEPGYVVLGF